MAVETTTIDGLDRLKSILDGTERIAGRDSSGDFRALISSIISYAISDSTLLTYMRENLIQSYDTGWVANSDWTDAEFTVTHNLDIPISGLVIKFLMSSDGTDDNSWEFNDISADRAATGDATWGSMVYQIDDNSFKIQTGANGINILESDGTRRAVQSDSYYYKIKVYKLNYS